HALAAADRIAPRHDADGPGLLKPPGHDRVVARVDKHLEAFLHELLRGLKRGYRVRQECLRIAKTFQLYPVSPRIAQVRQQLTSQAGVANRVLGAETACRVGQDGAALQVEKIEDATTFLVDEPLAPNGNRRHFAGTGGKAVAH